MTIDFAGLPNLHATAFRELSTVRLKADRDVQGQRLPAGSQGAVVFVYRGGDAYEVEFVDPIAAVLTLTASDLTQ